MALSCYAKCSERRFCRTRTRCIILDYVRHTLQQHCEYDRMHEIHHFFECLEETISMFIVRNVGDNIESDIHQAALLDNAAEQVNIEGQCTRANFIDIMKNIFGDKVITWGKLVKVIVYCGRLCLKAVTSGAPARVMLFVNWVEAYFRDNYLDDWIEEHGGWDCIAALDAIGWIKHEAKDQYKNILTGVMVAGACIFGVYSLLQQYIEPVIESSIKA